MKHLHTRVRVACLRPVTPRQEALGSCTKRPSTQRLCHIKECDGKNEADENAKSSPPSPMPAPEAWWWTATKTLKLKIRVLLLQGGVEPTHSFDLRRGLNTRVLCSLGGGGDSVSWGCGLYITVGGCRRADGNVGGRSSM
jgi:hypothetical protein